MTIIFIMLAAGTSFAVYRVIKQIFNQYQCITTQDIRAYKLSQLNQEDRRQVAVHVGVCEKCKLAMIEYDPDDTMEHLVE